MWPLKAWQFCISAIIGLQFNWHINCVAFTNFTSTRAPSGRSLSSLYLPSAWCVIMSVYLHHARLSTQGPRLTPVRKQFYQTQSKRSMWHVWCLLKHNVLWKHPYVLPTLSPSGSGSSLPMRLESLHYPCFILLHAHILAAPQSSPRAAKHMYLLDLLHIKSLHVCDLSLHL